MKFGRRQISILFFVLTIPLWVLGLDHFLKVKFPGLVRDERQWVLEQETPLPRAVMPEIKTAKEAKKRHIFWVDDRWQNGFAIDVLHDPELFSSVFPGYPAEMANDQGLWHDYFSREFNSSERLRAMAELAQRSFLINVPWTGCFDIYKRYGADVLIFGSSETYKTLIPEVLAEKVKSGLGIENPKILYCSTSGMPVAAVTIAARELFRLAPDKRAKIAIWGYSFWTAFETSKGIKKTLKEKVEDFENYQQSLGLLSRPIFATYLNLIKDSKLADAFPPVKWGMFMNTSFQDVRFYQTATRDQKAIQNFAQVPEEIGEDEEAVLKTIRLDLKPFGDWDYFYKMDDHACNMTGATHELNATLAALSLVAEHTFVYLAPVTPFYIHLAPPCFYPAVQKMLGEASNSKTVFSQAGTMSDYGLKFIDYLAPAREKKMLEIDMNHPNYHGAFKVTEHIGDWINQTEEKL